jgi:general L-amino acid transport system substrate-binding protein
MFRWLAKALVLSLLALALPANAQIVASIKASHHLDCGTVQSVEDWNGEDVHGDLSALGGEICRAVAVAILGGAEGLSIHAYPAEPEALAALKAGMIELAVGISPSATVATQFDVAFGPPVFYDSQRILVAKQSGITDLAGLRDQLICALDMSPPERTLRDELTARRISYALQAHSEQGELDAAVAVRRCAAGTGMESRLAQSRANFHARAGDFVFLPERLSLAPVVPAYSDKDVAFGRIVDWTVSALIEAEALGVTKDNVAEACKRQDMRAEQLLGHDFATAQALGLEHDWAARVIAATGNYGEIFERTTGKPYHLERGLNALWTEGGLMAPLPMK